MGIESVKSSTPAPCRVKIKEALQIIMKGGEQELNDFLISFRKEFKNYHQRTLHILVLVMVLKSLGQVTSIFIKGTPMHIKGSLVYNHMIKQKKLDLSIHLFKRVIRLSLLNYDNLIHLVVMSFHLWVSYLTNLTLLNI